MTTLEKIDRESTCAVMYTLTLQGIIKDRSISLDCKHKLFDFLYDLAEENDTVYILDFCLNTIANEFYNEVKNGKR